MLFAQTLCRCFRGIKSGKLKGRTIERAWLFNTRPANELAEK